MVSSSAFTRFKDFLRELKRRKVYQVGAVYVVVGYAVAQGAEYFFELVGLPEVGWRAVAIVLILGLPVALVLAWAYEGLRRMVDGGFRNYPWLTHDPWISSYRDDPTFQSLFEEVREAWERSR